MRVRDCRRCGWKTLDGRSYSEQPDARPEYRRYAGRGLCNTCHEAERQAGNLENWPRSNWPIDELLDEWDRLHSDGVNDLIDAAGRIGISPEALDRALHRALKHGDSRGRHAGCRKLDSLRVRVTV